jgi:Protein of unknown function (DUF3579)
MFPRESKPSFHILGLSQQRRVFRPSDWAERLAGIMAQFRDPNDASSHDVGAQALGSAGAYSSLVLPVFVPHPDHGGLDRSSVARAVFVDGRLFEVEPLAYAFLQQFAIDNELITQAMDRQGD